MTKTNNLLFSSAILPLLSFAEPARPNIIIVLADDMGYSDIGCYGGEIETPNLDQMAKDGIRFLRFYNAARSCPSRAALLTGLYPHQAGMGAMTGTRNINIPAYQGVLSRESVTIAEVLGAAGYQTFIAGKWHLGDDAETATWPHSRGFKRAFSYLGGACNLFDATWPGNKKQPPLVLDDQFYSVPKDFFMTEAITDFSCRFIRETPADTPVFGYVAHLAPHWPLQERPENIAKYKGCYDAGWDAIREERYERMKKLGVIGEKHQLALRGDGGSLVPAWDSLDAAQQADMAARMEVYAAQVSGLDQSVGKIIDVLKETGRYENTLILFLSDNGACAEPNEEAFGKSWMNPDAPLGTRESFVSYGRAWAEVSNVPFRLWKSKIQEGGIITPLITHWPAGISSPAKCDNRQVGHIIDIMATCLDVAGVEYPKEFAGSQIIPYEGISFAPVFQNQARKEHEFLAWEHFANAGVLKGDWKVVAETKNSPGGRRPGSWRLYNLSEDPTEMKDLSPAFPEKVQELNDVYRQWAAHVGVVDSLSDWQKKN